MRVARTIGTAAIAVPPEKQAPARNEADEKAWASAVAAGTIEAFERYLQDFKHGEHAAEARRRITELQETARKKAHEDVWIDTKREGTIVAFKRYLDAHPHGPYALEAWQRIRRIEEEAARREALKKQADRELALRKKQQAYDQCRAQCLSFRGLSGYNMKDCYDFCAEQWWDKKVP